MPSKSEGIVEAYLAVHSALLIWWVTDEVGIVWSGGMIIKVLGKGILQSSEPTNYDQLAAAHSAEIQT